MKRLFLVIVIGLLLSVGLVVLIESSPGYVLLSWGRYTLETSFWLGLVLLLLFNVLFYLLLRVMRRTLASRGSVASWLRGRREARGRRLTEQGMMAFASGRWDRARRLLLRAVPHQENPTLNYLAAARACSKTRDREKMHQYLDAATAEDGNTHAIALTRAELLLDIAEPQAALADLDELAGEEKQYPQILLLRLRALQSLSQWSSLADLLPELRHRKMLEDAELQDLETGVYLQLLNRSETATELKSTWSGAPDNLKQDPAVIARYCRALLRWDEFNEAEKVVSAALKRHWSPELVELFGRLGHLQPAKSLKRAEIWLREHPEDAVLLLALGRLSLNNELWGQARDYFESSLRLQPTPAGCAELGRLLAGLNEQGKSAHYYRQGLMLQQVDLPDLPQPQLQGSTR